MGYRVTRAALVQPEPHVSYKLSLRSMAKYLVYPEASNASRFVANREFLVRIDAKPNLAAHGGRWKDLMNNPLVKNPYRGTSLARKRIPVGPYRRPMPMVLEGF